MPPYDCGNAAEVLPCHDSDTITVKMFYTSSNQRETPSMDPQLQKKLSRSLEELSRIMPASPGLGPTPARPTASLRLPAQSDDPTTPSSRYHQGHFGPQHGLTPAQAWQAEQLLRQKKPFHGRHAQQKEAARKRGIIAAVKAGRVGNSAFGRSLHGKRGGKVMALHGLGHLRHIGLLGSQAAKSARERKKALTVWEQTGQILPLKTETGENIPVMDAWTAWKVSSMPFMMW